MTFSIKATYNNTIRRFSISEINFDALISHLQSLFTIPENARITYADNEGDIITISSDIELNELFNLVKQHNISPVRLHIYNPDEDIPKSSPRAAPAPQSQPNPTNPPPQNQNQQTENPANPADAMNMFANMISAAVAAASSSQAPSPFNPTSGHPRGWGGRRGRHGHGRHGHGRRGAHHGFGGASMGNMFGQFLSTLLPMLSTVMSDLSNISPAIREKFHQLTASVRSISGAEAQQTAMQATKSTFAIVRTWLTENLGQSGVPSTEAVDALVTSIEPTLSPVGPEICGHVNALLRTALADASFVAILRQLPLDMLDLEAVQIPTQFNREEWGDAVVPPAPIHPGESGSKVAFLQKVLTDLGYMDESMYALRAGIYGPRTKQAVIQLQREYGLQNAAALGVYDAITAASLSSVLEAQVPPSAAAGASNNEAGPSSSSVDSTRTQPPAQG